MAQIGLFKQHAAAGAGRVDQNGVHHPVHLLAVYKGIAHRRADVVQPQPVGQRLDQIHPVLMHIPGLHTARALHLFGHEGRFAAGRRACIQHLRAKLGFYCHGGHHAALSLDGE